MKFDAGSDIGVRAARVPKPLAGLIAKLVSRRDAADAALEEIQRRLQLDWKRSSLGAEGRNASDYVVAPLIEADPYRVRVGKGEDPMSTIAYAAITQKRQAAPPGLSESAAPPATGPYLDVLVALIPGEVLALHAYLLGLVTTDGAHGAPATVTDPGALRAFFWGLLGLSALLYVVRHARSWDRWDCLRVTIPPLAFTGWTMIQPTSAFDAVADGWTTATRYGVAAFGAILLGAVAAALASKADKQAPAAIGVPAEPAAGEVARRRLGSASA